MVPFALLIYPFPPIFLHGLLLLGRHRWVEYPTLNRYNVSGSKIPPEWNAFFLVSSNPVAHLLLRHSWLHFTTDLPAPKIKEKFENPRFKLEYRENQTATPNAYAPYNYYKNPRYNVAQAMGAKEEALKKVLPVEAPKSRHSYTADEL